MNKQAITVLGSTGSVGESTLSVVSRHPEKFQVFALTANENVDKLFEQCLDFNPKYAVMAQPQSAAKLKDRLKLAGRDEIIVSSGVAEIERAATEQEVDVVMSAIVGAAGLVPTLAAVKSSKKVLIANKEPLVMAGQLFKDEARKSGAQILPIDSEHNAIFQCLPADQSTRSVCKVHLTASGGPFLGRAWGELAKVTPEQACAHPNWSMGAKISVDSATMMNKGLEFIEATVLFELPPEQIEIVIHPQSIIHSLVEYCDGTFLAQMGSPDMRIPIAHALAWPERFESGAQPLDLSAMSNLEFVKPDLENLPCLRLAIAAAHDGGSATAALNAANEVAVDAFLKNRLPFTQIPDVIEFALEKVSETQLDSLECVLNIDNEARRYSSEKLDSLA